MNKFYCFLILFYRLLAYILLELRVNSKLHRETMKNNNFFNLEGFEYPKLLLIWFTKLQLEGKLSKQSV